MGKRSDSIYEPLRSFNAKQKILNLGTTTIGMAVPFFDFHGEPSAFNDWAITMAKMVSGDTGKIKNLESHDGMPTEILG